MTFLITAKVADEDARVLDQVIQVYSVFCGYFPVSSLSLTAPFKCATLASAVL